MEDTPETPIEPPVPVEPPSGRGDDPTAPLQRILEALLPEAGAQIEFEDVLGNRYRSPAVASLRTQAKLLDMVKSHTGLLRGLGSGEGAAGALMSAFSSPDLVKDLVDAMELLHPKAVKAAVGAVRKENDDETASTADAFSGEAMLGAVLPFFAGPILRLLVLIRPAVRS